MVPSTKYLVLGTKSQALGGRPGATGGRPGRPGGGRGAAGPAGEGKVWFRVHETTLWDKSPDSPDSPDPADSPDPVPEPALRPSLTTRAGGQDDVSLNKLPQIMLALFLLNPEPVIRTSVDSGGCKHV